MEKEWKRNGARGIYKIQARGKAKRERIYIVTGK